MSTIDWVFTRSDDKRGHLEATLALLHYEHFGRSEAPLPSHATLTIDVVRAIELFAKSDWTPDEGETRQQMFARIAKKNKEGRLHSAFPSAAEHYVRRTGKDWPLNWRLKHDFWIELADAIVESKSRENPATYWQLKIRDDEKSADMYRQCYMATARFAGEELFDESLIAPLLRKYTTSSAEALAWQARVLETLVAVGLDKDDQRRVAVRDRLLNNLKQPPADDGHKKARRRLAATLGPLYKIADKESEAEPILQAILNQNDPKTFRELANAISLSNENIYDWYTKKQVSVDFKDVRLKDALAQLQRQVLIPTWIAADVVDDKTPVTLKSNDTWKQTVDAVLARSPYEFANLGEGLFWVGNPMNLKQAIDIVQQGAKRIPDDARRTADALREVARLEFIETPLSDVLDYLQDFGGIQIEMLGKHGDTSITFSMQVPLHTFLTLVTAKYESDWFVSGDAVMIGTKKEVAAFRKRDEVRKGRLEKISAVNRRMVAALQEPTKVEFIETPLIDVSEYLSDRYVVRFYVARDTPRDTTVTNDLTGNLAWTLDVMLHHVSLDWDSDGHVIYIGNEKALKAFQELADSRSKRREAYPKDLSKHLQAPFQTRFVSARLSRVIKYLRDNTKLQFNLDADDAKLADLSITEFLDQPLDVTLDLMSLSHGIDWRVANGSVHIQRKK